VLEYPNPGQHHVSIFQRNTHQPNSLHELSRIQSINICLECAFPNLLHAKANGVHPRHLLVNLYDTIRVVCDDDYYFKDNQNISVDVVCQVDGSFRPEVPTCYRSKLFSRLLKKKLLFLSQVNTMLTLPHKKAYSVKTGLGLLGSPQGQFFIKVCDDKRDQLSANRARLGVNGPEYLQYLEINL